jgi:hypothetical protein
VHQLIRSPVRVVGEEHPAVFGQAGGHQRPEGVEALRRHVRQPEAEEHHVVSAVGNPVEQIGPNEPDPVAVGPGRGRGEHLR